MTKSANGYQCQNTFIAVLCEGATVLKPLFFIPSESALFSMLCNPVPGTAARHSQRPEKAYKEATETSKAFT